MKINTGGSEASQASGHFPKAFQMHSDGSTMADHGTASAGATICLWHFRPDLGWQRDLLLVATLYSEVPRSPLAAEACGLLLAFRSLVALVLPGSPLAETVAPVPLW